MKIQLRIYTINRGALEAFAREWREHVLPLREQQGFRILGAWTVAETNQFVWIMAHDGPGDWDTADRGYYAAPERRALDPDPARHIARIEHHFVEPATGR